MFRFFSYPYRLWRRPGLTEEESPETDKKGAVPETLAISLFDATQNCFGSSRVL